MTDTVALIVAAGRGHRAGGELPKQYRLVAGQSLIRRSCVAFLNHPRIDAVGAVIHPDDADIYAESTDGLELLPPIQGGATRQDSCRNGLESLAELAPERVLIHDAARPFVDKAHTPQGFRYAEILEAHRKQAAHSLTDDAAVAEAAGLAVALTPGSEDNFKLTTEDDFARAERMLGAGDIRVGSGFDVHRFDEGNAVMLCGIKINFDKSMAGHSDADVALHAITDALLGAIGEGDIGSHFPPGDPQWRGADSALFLRHAAELVGRRGGEIRHLDVTLICEGPKIGPHREAMRARVAKIAGVGIDRVSVKATTTEGLGFTGRGEGIAAQATATVRL
jgi:2-C-methyl-D-erythritol 4-phosphate cytidylyltransferase/2-C-methyl-D-erythritol 2,4-cyclodiphosphate synthase